MHVEVEPLDVADLDEARPLWLALRDHLDSVVRDDWAPPRSDDDTWQQRRAQYATWLAEADSFALVARDEDRRAVGYAVTAIREASPSRDTGRTAEIETLSVDRDRRGEGIGRLLLLAAEERLDALGIAERYIGYLVENEGAARFYAREGYEPAFVVVRRVGPRQPPMGAQP